MAPQVAGICALLLETSRGRRLTPVARARLVRGAIVGSARPIACASVDACGAGLFNAAAAHARVV